MARCAHGRGLRGDATDRGHVTRALGRLALAAATLCTALLSGGCAPDPQHAPPPGTSEQAEQGRLLLRQFGCGGCHRIPGVAAAKGLVGPPLEDIGQRVYLGGVLPNSPQNMARWIMSPQEFDPPTTMPDLGVTQAQAQAMVAYLYRQR
jgi:cytochrome c